MADHHHLNPNQTVCCMCGDVGFPDKLFSCKRCRFRFQHSYCSSYYGESSSNRVEICDWCQSEASNNVKRQGKRSGEARSEYVLDKSPIKQHEELPSPTGDKASTSGRNPGGAPSPRQSTRRYKLLKDVMC